jgi:outer membrane lipoprotein-sorting protein
MRYFIDHAVVMSLAGLLLASASGSGRAGELSVEEVVRQVRAQDDAIDDQTTDVEIRTVDAAGNERSTTQRLDWKNLRGAKGLIGQTLLVTMTPLQRKGESFLLWQAARAGDSQAWLYLPDLRQALRITIAGQDAQRPKRNADMLLGFEQLGGRLLEDAPRVLAGREPIDGTDYVIVEERLPGEIVRRFWVSPANWTIAKIDYRDAGGRLDRTQFIEWQRVGRAWVWKRVEVRATDPPVRTVVELSRVSVNTGLSDRLFTVNSLKSGTIR